MPRKPDETSGAGYAMAAMLVRAAAAESGGTSAMIKALEGYSFQSVQGQVTIRASDHAFITPFFKVTLTQSGTEDVAHTAAVIPAASLTPPESP